MQENNELYKLTDKKINNEHDKIFRKILDNKNEAANFIYKRLNYKIDAHKLEKYNSSFITKDLKNQETDIIYKIKDKNIYFFNRTSNKNRLFNAI